MTSARHAGRRRFRLVAALASAAALVVPLAACGSDSGPEATDHPIVVASTDVWASVASAVAGENGEVSALFNTPGGDPHEFEPSSGDTARVQDANVIVMNGGHYDAYMEQASADAGGEKVVALADHEDHDHGDAEGEGTGHEGEGGHSHDHGEEHAFYDLAIVSETAGRIADALSKVAPAHADAYRANAKAFQDRIGELRTRLGAIRSAHPNAKVAATEPLATGLLNEAGITDAAPAGFANAVEEGQSPSAADRATFEDLLRTRGVSALIYNVQAVDPATEAVLAIAKSSGVPVVNFTESLPEGVTEYVAWQSAQIAELEKALRA